MSRFTGKAAVVTGGAMGMGFGTAKVLGSQGAKLALFDKSDKLPQAVEELKAAGVEVVGYQVDVRDSAAVKEACQKAIKQYGKIDILVNVAGVGILQPFLQTSDETRDLIFDINIKGIWNTCQGLIPHMVENQYGKIVNYSSVTGFQVADPGECAYGISKAGIIGLTKTLAVEFATDGITVNAICPGYILTPMVQKIAKENDPDNPQSVIDGIAGNIPIGRLGTPEEAGDLVAFLASDESRYITGVHVNLDGGSVLPETFVVQGTEHSS
ncbi:SDR family oxidoreductase [Ruminococcaceae bacterium OttesenSCG-928-I18]|nr:SDR family oxidoreductase [Ruminococcaceae bacterium OttesenSCG-928-I18]